MSIYFAITLIIIVVVITQIESKNQKQRIKDILKNNKIENNLEKLLGGSGDDVVNKHN